jgi:flagellar motor protein MotB
METNENNTPAYTPLESASTPPTQRPKKSGGNQLTTVLIVIIVVILFAMLMLSINGQLFLSNQNGRADVVALEARNTQLRADANAERARQGLPPLPDDSSSARMMADRIQRDATSLASLTGQWQTELETKDAALSDLHNQLTSRDANAKRLYAQIAMLQSKLDQAGVASDQLVRMSNDIKMANNQIENYRKQLAELQGRPSSDQLAMLRNQLNESIAMRSKLQMQIDTLLGQTKNKIDRTQYDEAMAELAKIRPEFNKQRYEIQRLRALLDRARLFIESEKDLPVHAARLFAKLRTLDNTRGDALAAAYKDIENSLGARVIHRQNFATGKSQITFDRETMIKNAMGGVAGVDSYFLIVGYASKTGDAASNRKLSAARATTAASVVNLLKTPQQDVRAVYLGQTNRFSTGTPKDNQICEVWEIKK